MSTKKQQVRELAEASLYHFIKLVHPNRVLGGCHKEVIDWWQREEALDNQILLFPRDHQKSALAAYRVAHWITKHPDTRILYISSTSNLAEKQLKFIKDILTSKIYTYYWPEMVKESKFDRELWNQNEFSVDHPKRAEENVRDPTVFTAGLTTVITGLHADIVVADDLVEPSNAYTPENRERVKDQFAQLSSIAGTDGQIWVVGTRYHPQDLYGDIRTRVVEIVNSEGELVESEFLYEVFERPVEDRGDGSGEFLWPRTVGNNGKTYGFNQRILAAKRAGYKSATQFRAQYYNDPNATEEAPIKPSTFQYFDKERVQKLDGHWSYFGKRLNVFASVDFAYSLSKRADSTCIVVVGIDPDNRYYVLDIDRFKTGRISDYYDRILRLYQKWGFRKMRAEVTAAQEVIVNDLKENYIRANGLGLSIEEFRPTRHMGSKSERIMSILQPRYDNLQVYHYKGGNIDLLEEELIAINPPHDDIKDALASCIDMCVAPVNVRSIAASRVERNTHSRFGGIN